MPNNFFFSAAKNHRYGKMSSDHFTFEKNGYSKSAVILTVKSFRIWHCRRREKNGRLRSTVCSLYPVDFRLNLRFIWREAWNLFDFIKIIPAHLPRVDKKIVPHQLCEIGVHTTRNIRIQLIASRLRKQYTENRRKPHTKKTTIFIQYILRKLLLIK